MYDAYEIDEEEDLLEEYLVEGNSERKNARRKRKITETVPMGG